MHSIIWGNPNVSLCVVLDSRALIFIVFLFILIFFGSQRGAEKRFRWKSSARNIRGFGAGKFDPRRGAHSIVACDLYLIGSALCRSRSRPDRGGVHRLLLLVPGNRTNTRGADEGTIRYDGIGVPHEGCPR